MDTGLFWMQSGSHSFIGMKEVLKARPKYYSNIHFPVGFRDFFIINISIKYICKIHCVYFIISLLKFWNSLYAISALAPDLTLCSDFREFLQIWQNCPLGLLLDFGGQGSNVMVEPKFILHININQQIHLDMIFPFLTLADLWNGQWSSMNSVSSLFHGLPW